jgi:hypothetical protein
MAGYSTVSLVGKILASTLTSASPSGLTTPVDLIQIGRTFDFNVVPEDDVEEYIKLADEEINSAINELYATPLCEIADFETTLLTDIDEYNEYIITSASCPFYVGDILYLTDGTNEERHVISEIVSVSGNNAFETEEPVSYSFSASDTRILRLKYPEPISLMSARLAAANVYEKYFMAESSPSQSEYGKWMRGMVRANINNILNGRTILHGAQRIGLSKFINSNLAAQYGLPNNKGSNDMDTIQ